MREALEMREHWSRRVPSFAPTETLTLGAAPSTAHEMIKTGRQPSAWMNTQPGENGGDFGEAPHVTALISVLTHVRQAPNLDDVPLAAVPFPASPSPVAAPSSRFTTLFVALPSKRQHRFASSHRPRPGPSARPPRARRGRVGGSRCRRR